MYIFTIFVPLCIFLPIVIIYSICRIRKSGLVHSFVNILFVLYILVVFSFLLFPWKYAYQQEYYKQIVINYIPFKYTIMSFNTGSGSIIINAIKDNLINLLMLCPVGLYYGLVDNNYFSSYVKMLVFGMSGEILQLVFSCIGHNLYRQIDITDFILNILGIFIAFILIKKSPTVLEHKTNRKWIRT